MTTFKDIITKLQCFPPSKIVYKIFWTEFIENITKLKMGINRKEDRTPNYKSDRT